MSFQAYDAFPNQGGPQDGTGAGQGVPQQQDSAMGGQQMDNTSAPFQGGPVGEPGSAGGQPGGDAKTTLWSVFHGDQSLISSLPTRFCRSRVIRTSPVILHRRTIMIIMC